MASTVEKCVFWGVYLKVYTSGADGAADWDNQWVVANNVFYGGNYVGMDWYTNLGTGTPGYPYNHVVTGNTIVSGQIGINQSQLGYSVSNQYLICKGNVIRVPYNGRGFSSSNTAIIEEDWNVIEASQANVNTTNGSNSVYKTYWSGLEGSHGFLTPLLPTKYSYDLNDESPLIGFIPAATSIASWPTEDIAGRPRPGGGSTDKTPGAVEAYSIGTADSTNARNTSGTAILLTGPQVQDFELAVDAVAVKVYCWVKFESGSYGGTTYPSIGVLNGALCGVVDATSSDDGSASDAWVQLVLNISPASAGLVTIRLTNSSTSSSGKCWFDDFSIERA